MAADAKPLIFRERLEGAFAPEVWFTAAPLCLLGALAWFASLPWLSWPCWLLALGCGWFFRNPKRRVPPGDEGERLALAPADGRIIAVGEEPGEGGARLRIGIFLSVFDVHVNRAPLSGEVISIHRGGAGFRAAFAAEAADNVQLCMALRTKQGLPFEVVQIAGWIARRIVCHPFPGEWLKRGARYGLIRFGSRTDLLLPPGSRALVQKGARVIGGITPLAELPEAEAL
ncbi:MAG: phosphatidylserine decarboxylase [Deltaproteobacteria bacterium]|nr:phosphatidylserine decarboxylase [Deltaproteobacteria bacterium]MDD9852532.1 phosphatidylserine decarboxylase [Deltaproteobacteria bacterium]MDD9872206.1 phosphatidylserine decarboxylase [Deltaproteobacteria bacterium]